MTNHYSLYLVKASLMHFSLPVRPEPAGGA